MIKIISKDYCPYCDLAKGLITSLGFKYEEIDVSKDEKKLQEIITISHMLTVPQIYVGEIKKENLLGGYSDIKKLHDEGRLLKLLNN